MNRIIPGLVLIVALGFLGLVYIFSSQPAVSQSGNAVIILCKQSNGSYSPCSSTANGSLVDENTSSQFHTDLTAAAPCLNATTSTTNSYGTGTTNPTNCDLNGKLYVDNGDPCGNFANKLFADFESGTSGGSIITAVSAKKAYLCSISIVVSAAANISLIEGTGSSVCTGGTTAGVFLNNSTTAANGAALAANGSISLGNGEGSLAANATANQNICVLFTTTNTPQVNVHVTYVQQ